MITPFECSLRSASNGGPVSEQTGSEPPLNGVGDATQLRTRS